MKHYSKLLTILFLLTFSASINAQELTNYNLYQQNNYLFNPAITGNDGCITAFANSRFQWVGIDGAPATNSFGIQGFLTRSMGMGIFIANDKHSNFNNLNAKLSYSYRIIFGKDHFLSFGAAAGIFNNSVNFDDVINYDPTDPLMQTDYYNSTQFSANFGLFYSFKQLELQLALPQLFHEKQANFFTLGSIAYDVLYNNPQWDLKPMVMVQKPTIGSLQAEANMVAMWKKTIWTSIGYRTDKTLIAGVGFNYKNLGIGYATQFGFSPINNFSRGTHEIQLVVKFGNKLCEKQSNRTVITGRVSSIADNSPVKTQVIVYKDKRKVGKAKTDTSGFYRLELKPDNSYEIGVEDENYQEYKEFLSLNATQTEKTVNIKLLPGSAVVKGKILDSKTNSKIDATIEIYKYDSILVDRIDAKGDYKIKLKPNESYTFVAVSDGYFSQKFKINITLTKNLHVIRDIILEENVIGKIYEIRNITFKTGTSKLTKESYTILDSLVDILLANPELKIELGGHTDNMGSASYNLILSKERAQICADYIISKGVEPDKIEVVGYGEAKPLVPNDTEINRDKNRRVEYKIIE